MACFTALLSSAVRRVDTPVFVGTRVPVRALLDYLEHGRPLAEFLDDVPTVEKALAIGVLEHVKQLVAHAPSSR